MAARMRPAVPSDVEQVMRIRRDLALRPDRPRPAVAGGFLLGSPPDVYRRYIERGCLMVAESGGEVIAYSVVLPDDVLRGSEVYAKRDQAGLPAALLDRLLRMRVAYFDQLAATPGRGAAAAGLAYQHLLEACRTHQAVLATTVVEPVENLAAVPLLQAVGFVPVGLIDETYPEVGHVGSRVYLVERGAIAALRVTPRATRFERRVARHQQSTPV